MDRRSLIKNAGIAGVLASATSLKQLQELTAAMDLTLSPEQLEQLNSASAEAVPA